MAHMRPTPASTRERDRPVTIESTNSCMITITAVLAAKITPMYCSGRPTEVVMYNESPASTLP